MPKESRDRVVDLLHELQCSCVICNGEEIRSFNQRGIKDLFELLHSEPHLLNGAFVADKVVGKGAAALMILGGIADLHADVLSRPAAELLQNANITFTYGKLADNIINRQGDGICPVERLCSKCATAQECLPLITDFVTQLR